MNVFTASYVNQAVKNSNQKKRSHLLGLSIMHLPSTKIIILNSKISLNLTFLKVLQRFQIKFKYLSLVK